MKIDWNQRGQWLSPESLLATAKRERAKSIQEELIRRKVISSSPWKFFAIAAAVFFLMAHPVVRLPRFAPQMLTAIVGDTHHSSSGAACTPTTGYLHCRVLTIDHNQVGGSTLTNFPVLVSTSFGVAQSATCLDHVYTSDSGGTSPIPWEIDHCTPPAGVTDWVLVTPISSSADTLFYVSYNNASITVGQNTGAAAPTNVWASAYQFVAHLTSTGDSTSNVHNCSLNGTVNGAAAHISSGFSTNGTAANYTTCSASIQVNAHAMTVSGWAKSNLVNTGYIANKNFDGTRVPYSLGNPGSSEPGFGFYDGAWHSTGVTTNYRNDGLFHYIVGTYDGTTLRYYFDGGAETTLSYSGSTGTGTGLTSIGAYINNSEAWNGILDEVRIMNTVLTPGEIIANMNSQSTGSTFVGVGAEI